MYISEIVSNIRTLFVQAFHSKNDIRAVYVLYLFVSQRLPDLFTGIRVVVPDSASKSAFLRYFIAYPFYNRCFFRRYNRRNSHVVVRTRALPTIPEFAYVF